MAKQEASGVCPTCGMDIFLSYQMDVDDIVYCDHCDAELVITRVNPLKLKVNTTYRLNNSDEWDDEI